MVRYNALLNWLSQQTGFSGRLQPLLGDAGQRRYYRFWWQQRFYLAADVPCPVMYQKFVHWMDWLSARQIPVPIQVATEPKQGFCVLTDWGEQRLYDAKGLQRDRGYDQALALLLAWQRLTPQVSWELPRFEVTCLAHEWQQTHDWFFPYLLQRPLNPCEEGLWQRLGVLLTDAVTWQPHTLVHRDYHAKNIMLQHHGALGLLDFQDALWGSVVYDLVSLLKDAYVTLTCQQRDAYLRTFYQSWIADQRQRIDFATFERWFDWAGLQRHIKCLGNFTRLHLAASKSGYLVYLPRLLGYIQEVCHRYVELRFIRSWFDDMVLPEVDPT